MNGKVEYKNLSAILSTKTQSNSFAFKGASTSLTQRIAIQVAASHSIRILISHNKPSPHQKNNLAQKR
jgi:hypothetical protein